MYVFSLGMSIPIVPQAILLHMKHSLLYNTIRRNPKDAHSGESNRGANADRTQRDNLAGVILSACNR